MKQRIKALIIAAAVFILVINLAGYLIKAPEVSNLNKGKVELIGHAGSGFNYLVNPWNPLPANSLASINKALEDGAQGVEVDVQVSKDSVLILFHDLQLDSKTTLKGEILSYNSTELLNCNYKLGFPYDIFHQEKLISLNKLIEELSGRDLKLYLDIKFNKQSDEKRANVNFLVKSIIKFLNNTEFNKSNITIISSSSDIIQKLHAKNQELNYALDCGEDATQYIVGAQSLGCKYLCISYRNATSEMTQQIHDADIEVILFGGKSKIGLRKMLELNPDVVQVNNVKAMKKLLN